MQHSQRKRIRRSTPALGALFFVMLAEPAWAYLDPGTGSMIISAIVGLFATVGLAVKTYWYKIKAFLRRDSGSAETVTEPAVDTTADQAANTERPTES